IDGTVGAAGVAARPDSESWESLSQCDRAVGAGRDTRPGAATDELDCPPARATIPGQSDRARNSIGFVTGSDRAKRAPGVADAALRRRLCSVDRLRERGESAAGARHGSTP